MAKFYVDCGPVRIVLTCDSADAAVSVTLDRVFAADEWIYHDPDLGFVDRRDHLMLEALLTLAPSIRVSQRGFGRCDAGRFGTPEMVDRWHRQRSRRVHACPDASGSADRPTPSGSAGGGVQGSRQSPQWPR